MYKIKKSIFANILIFFSYVSILIFLILANGFYLYLISYCMFHPMYSILLAISAIVAIKAEIKHAETNGFIINIPDKITESWWYNILFWAGIIIDIVVCILRIYMITTWLPI